MFDFLPLNFLLNLYIRLVLTYTHFCTIYSPNISFPHCFFRKSYNFLGNLSIFHQAVMFLIDNLNIFSFTFCAYVFLSMEISLILSALAAIYIISRP